MLNYHKTYRESLDKSKKRPTPKKQPTINRSHTSSINLKLSTDLDQMKTSIKNFKENNDPLRKDIVVNHSKSKSNIKNQHTVSTSQFKYSFKLKQDPEYYDGSRVRMKTNYEQLSSIKPFRQSNRCLITERNEKTSDYKYNEKSLTKRNDTHMRTEYKQNSEHQDFLNTEHSKYDEVDLKSRKQVSTKHNTQSINSNSKEGPQMIKIPLNELKKLYEQYKLYQNEVSLLQKELNFYRKTASKNSKNSVALALAD